MTADRVFGEIAELYDDVRPAYPPQLLDAIVDFHGGQPRNAADVGAGTGKATELLVRLGVPITCVEPDPRMAAVLSAKFPHVSVVNAAFEDWAPPAGGLDLAVCGLAWHWLDEAERNRRMRDALAPRGVLAVFAHTYGYADPAVDAAITAVMQSVDPRVRERADHWLVEDVTGSGVWSDVDELVWHTYPEFTRDRYLQLVQTFSPFRRHPRDQQEALLAGLAEALDGTLTLDLTTTLVLARAS